MHEKRLAQSQSNACWFHFPLIEPTCAHIQWALRHHLLPVCPPICPSVRGQRSKGAGSKATRGQGQRQGLKGQVSINVKEKAGGLAPTSSCFIFRNKPPFPVLFPGWSHVYLLCITPVMIVIVLNSKKMIGFQITVFDMNKEEDLDLAILSALLKGRLKWHCVKKPSNRYSFSTITTHIIHILFIAFH